MATVPLRKERSPCPTPVITSSLEDSEPIFQAVIAPTATLAPQPQHGMCKSPPPPIQIGTTVSPPPFQKRNFQQTNSTHQNYLNPLPTNSTPQNLSTYFRNGTNYLPQGYASIGGTTNNAFQNSYDPEKQALIAKNRKLETEKAELQAFIQTLKQQVTMLNQQLKYQATLVKIHEDVGTSTTHPQTFPQPTFKASIQQMKASPEGLQRNIDPLTLLQRSNDSLATLHNTNVHTKHLFPTIEASHRQNASFTLPPQRNSQVDMEIQEDTEDLISIEVFWNRKNPYNHISFMT